MNETHETYMNTAFIFDTTEKAQKFYNTAIEMGLDAKIVGNAVIAYPHTLETVCNHYYVDPDKMPVWTNGILPGCD